MKVVGITCFARVAIDWSYFMRQKNCCSVYHITSTIAICDIVFEFLAFIKILLSSVFSARHVNDNTKHSCSYKQCRLYERCTKNNTENCNAKMIFHIPAVDGSNEAIGDGTFVTFYSQANLLLILQAFRFLDLKRVPKRSDF